MKNEDYLNRSYIRFTDFLSIAVSRELEYFILDSKFTSAFNYRVKEIIRAVEKEGKKDAELSVLFNTEGEIALIDAGVLGKFISDNYSILVERYYKGVKLEKVIKNIKCGGDKVKIDFVKISYSILYKGIEELYKEIRCKKELKDKYMDKYNLKKYAGNDSTAIVIVLLILEDICKYIEINDGTLFSSIDEIIFSNNL